MSARTGEVGFTLLEMIVVVAVLGLMALLVVSRGPLRSAGLGGEVRRVVARCEPCQAAGLGRHSTPQHTRHAT